MLFNLNKILILRNIILQIKMKMKSSCWMRGLGLGSTHSTQTCIMERLFTEFSIIEIVKRIFLSMIITNASDERLFSKLKWVKNESRNRMTQLRLNN